MRFYSLAVHACGVSVSFLSGCNTLFITDTFLYSLAVMNKISPRISINVQVSTQILEAMGRYIHQPVFRGLI